jgi:hypothetical protein
MNWWQKCRDWYRKYDGAVEFLGLTVVAPCLVYGFMFGSLTPHTDWQAMVATALAVAGMVTWVARNH